MVMVLTPPVLYTDPSSPGTLQFKYSLVFFSGPVRNAEVSRKKKRIFSPCFIKENEKLY